MAHPLSSTKRPVAQRLAFTSIAVIVLLSAAALFVNRPRCSSFFRALTGGTDDCRGLVPMTEQPHALLQKLFICVSFHFRVTKLIYLSQVLQMSRAYPTVVDICIITDAPEKLKVVLQSWNLPTSCVCGTYNKLPPNEKYALLFEHRALIANRSTAVNYTTVVYLEDDTGVEWEALQSWAADTEILEPLGFIRGFYRTEVHQETGETRMLDTREARVDVSVYKERLEAAVPPSRQACTVVNPNGSFWDWREEPAGCVHTHYLSPARPYFGMWLATAAQLQQFMQSPYWSKEGALTATLGVEGHKPWGYPEKSAGAIQFVDVPPGFQSRSVLPYDAVLHSLLPTSQIRHERNGYQDWLHVRPEDFII